MSRAKFINIKIENFFENAVLFKKCSNIHIMVNFLGSCHPASKHIEAGTQYGKYKEVYFNLKSVNGKYAIVLTFSGPTKFDIKKPNIKSITKEAKEILDDLISNINLLIEENKGQDKKMQVYLDIKGHSRGGIIAENIYEWFSLNSSNLKIKLGKLIIADPYAGPVNRIIKKGNDNFDYLNKNIKSVPESKIVVYTVAERRFRDPAKSLNSDVIVFTDVTHDRTKYIAEYIFYESEYKGVYICADPMTELNKMYVAVNKNPTDKEQSFINKWFSKNIKPVDDKNIESILNGRENFKNFAYNKISSDGRRLLFYSALAKKCNQKCVKEFLENSGHKSMWKKVAKTLDLKEKN